MNNKGFTMIELLIIIGLLGIVSIMMAINMSGILGSEKEDEYENFKQAIESAACTYIDKQANVDLRNQFKNSGGGNIFVSDLIEDGLLDEEMVDASTNKTILEEQNQIYVFINWVDMVKTCTFKRN